MEKNKPRVILEIEPDGNVNMQSNIPDAAQIRSILRLAEELLVARALKAFSSTEQKIEVVPAGALKIIKSN